MNDEQKDMFKAKETTVRYESPKVSLIAGTELDEVRAAALLIFTKSTRLQMNGDGLEAMVLKVQEDPDWAYKELDYMSKTIRSSWEFLDFIFVVENVSRACAQQITRTRLASYAMQSQRVTDMSNVSFHKPDFGSNIDAEESYDYAIEQAIENYRNMVSECHASLEDARGVLPMNVNCNLVAKYNFRTIVDLIHARTSPRVQGEYRMVAMQMKDQILRKFVWADLFMRRDNDIAHALLDEINQILVERPSDHELRMLFSKVRDTLK